MINFFEAVERFFKLLSKIMVSAVILKSLMNWSRENEYKKIIKIRDN